MSERWGVIGGGGWGTALSMLLARSGREVRLWVREEEVVHEVNHRRTNERFLPGVAIPEGVTACSGDPDWVVRDADAVILVVPSQYLRLVARAVAPYLSRRMLIAHATKGIEESSLLRMSEVLRQEWPEWAARKVAVLSGPSHAEEVARCLPTTVVVAGRYLATLRSMQAALSGPTFRVYLNRDVVGVELGGALKNVVALAAGVSDGLGFGDNAKAALMTRGLAEIARLGTRLGAKPRTFSGLSGMGDMIVTCCSVHSRNRRAGFRIGQGERPDAVLASSPMVVEGVPTTRAACALAGLHGVDMPIARALHGILFGGLSPEDAVRELMTRILKQEEV